MILVLTEFILMYRGLYTSTQMFVDWNTLKRCSVFIFENIQMRMSTFDSITSDCSRAIAE